MSKITNEFPSILVVDDEVSIRGILTEVLSGEGYAVASAESGEEALQMFNENEYSLVITDIRMPGMSGIELLEKIKKINPDTEVMIITSNASQETAIKALRYGAYDYLIKPFEDLELISYVTSRAVERLRLVEENKKLLTELREKNEELEKSNKILKHLAVRDGLTGLLNHRAFQDGLKTEIMRTERHGHPFSLIMMDVDYFKHYNDVNGHPAGDAVLITIAKIFKENMRKTDLVARYGGEEFVALLSETPKESALTLAEKIRQNVEAYEFDGGKNQPEGRVTLSIGLATFPEDADNGKALIEKADKALYEAKAGGKNKVVVCG